MNKSSKSKKRFKSIVSLLLVTAILITGALAYLTATDSKTNTFTVGNVSLILQEPEWDEKNGENITPGETVAKDPEIVNNGTVDAYVYLSVSVPKGEYTFIDDVTGATIEGVNTKLFEYDYNDTNWKEFAYVEGETEDTIYYYYDGILEAGDTTEALFEEVSLIDLVSGSGAEGQELNIIINGFGIQSNFDDSEIDTPVEAWNALVNQSENANLPTVATTVELNFVNALGETAQTTVFELEDAADTEITVPDIAVGGYGAYVTTYGNELEPNTTVLGSDLIVPAETGSNTISVIATQPVIETTIQGDGSSNPVKLVPAEGYDSVVERNGIVETYYDGANSVTTDYPYTDTDFSNYFVYGVGRRQEKIETFVNLFKVQGDGYAVIYAALTPKYVGTGSIIEVYNSDNELVEKFTVVKFADVNSDGFTNAVDVSLVHCYVDGRIDRINTNNPAYLKAVDFNKNGVIDAQDSKWLAAISLASYLVNQSTGQVYDRDGNFYN